MDQNLLTPETKLTMPALTLWQPWASLIALGAKQVETRSWPTSYRGDIAIHAATRWTKEEAETCLNEPFWSVLTDGGFTSPFKESLPFGSIVAVAALVGCWSTGRRPVSPYPWVTTLTPQERAFGDYSHSRYGWLLESIRPLPSPIPCRGFQQLWHLPEDVDAAVRAGLAEGAK
jgi:hypothetical protein